MQQPKSKVWLSSSLTLNHFFLCISKTPPLRQCSGGISLLPKSPEIYKLLLSLPHLAWGVWLITILSERTYWTRLQKKQKLTSKQTKGNCSTAALLYPFLSSWRSLAWFCETDIFLTCQETVFLCVCGTQPYLGIEATANPREEMEALFLEGRERTGSRARHTFRTCSIREPPKHNNSLWLNPQSVDSDRGYLALTILPVFAPGGYSQQAKGNSGNSEAG